MEINEKTDCPNPFEIKKPVENKFNGSELFNNSKILTRILETIPIPVFYKDISGKYIACNKKFEDFTGQDRKEVIGKTVFELWPEKLAEKYLAKDQELIQNPGKQIYEGKVASPDGKEKDVIFHKATFTDDSGRVLGIVGAINDITEFKRIIFELENSETEKNAILNSSRESVFLIDIYGNIILANEGIANRLGTTVELLKGKNIYEFVSEDVAKRRKAVAQKVIEKGKPIILEDERDGKTILSSLHPVFDREKKVEKLAIFGMDITALRKAESCIHEKEEVYKITIESAIDGYCHCDVEGNILDVNEAYCRLVGYTREELLGMEISDLEVNGDNKQLALHIDQVIKKGKYRFETKTRTKDGRIIDVEISTSYLECGSPGFFSFIRDITKDKFVEREREITIHLLGTLAHSDNIYEAIKSVTELIQNCSGCEAVGIRLKDGEDYPYYQTLGFPHNFVRLENSLCRKGCDGNILRDDIGNPVLECMCGNIIQGRFDPEKPFFSPHGSFWTNSTSELLATTTESDRLTRTRNRCHGEGYESVALIPLKSQGVNFGLMQLNDSRKGMFTIKDINMFERLADNISIALAQHKAQNAVIQSEKKLDSIFTAAPIGLGVIKDRTIKEANVHLCEIIGYSYEEIIGYSADILYACLDEYDYAGKETYRLLSEKGTFSVETKLKRRDGKIIDVLLSSTPIDMSDLSRGVAFSALDITDRKKAEEALINSKLIADNSNRIKSEILKNVSHEFRTPLTTILGFSDILLNEVDNDFDTPKKKYLELINQSGKQLLQLIEKMLDYSDLEYTTSEQFELQSVNLKDIVNETVNIFRANTSKKNIHISAIIDHNVNTIVADKRKLETILFNLIENAIKFTNSGGAVNINVSYDVDNNALFSIQDTGIGIVNEKIDSIFDAFVQADGSLSRKYGGTGLGLALVKKLVEMHDGHIWVESELGKGTVFKFKIPLKTEN